MKGLSPLIASVLLIAFSVSLALLLSGWVTSLFKSTAGTTTEQSGLEVKCNYASFDIAKADVVYNFTLPANDLLNVSVINTGIENLNNFTFFVVTDTDAVQFLPSNQRDSSNPLRPGEGLKFSMTSGSYNIGGTFKRLVVTALCRNKLIIKQEVDMTL